MRNLSLLSTRAVSLPPNSNVCGTAIDLDQNVLYIASERVSPDGEVEIELWKSDGTSSESNPELFTMFSTIASSASGSSYQLVSLKVIPDSRGLVAVMRGGDITMISLDDEKTTPEVQGSVDEGLLAASWSSDDTLLAFVTGDKKLILMTSTFDVLSEAPIETNDFGEDAPINVGWGSKQTQFHGSLGKAAAQAAPTVAVGSSPDDDGLPRISWRGDGAYFVVSSLSSSSPNSLAHRTLRVYDRQGALQSTSESVPGLEHSLSWRPSGNLIASAQRFGFEGGGAGRSERHDVVFFERNGLRHGDFELRPKHLGLPDSASDLRWGYKVKEVRWSSDSNVLALWIEQNAGDIVQLWTTGNYHWYLKQEISAAALSSSQSGRFTSVEWHPEIALQLILTTPVNVITQSYAWETISSPSMPPIDSGLVAVADGVSTLLTPFRTQNVPPPMSSYQLSLLESVEHLPASNSRVPVHFSFSASSDTLGVLWEPGLVELWSLRTRLGPGRGKVMDPVKLGSWMAKESADLRYRQISLLGTSESSSSCRIVLLGSRLHGADVVVTVDFNGQAFNNTASVDMSSGSGRVLASREMVIWQAQDGSIFQGEWKDCLAQKDLQDSSSTPTSRFSEFCFVTQQLTFPDSVLYVGLTESGKLQIARQNALPRILASNATSFTVASGYLIYTTGAHEVTFAPLKALPDLLVSDNEGDAKSIPTDWEKRRVERGSKIVVCVPSSMSLVLQMPRGNLETINPRPLVLEVIRQDLDTGQYRKAFFACRKHRIDLNFLVEHNQAAFLEGLPSFLEQVHEVDHINLFLTNIGRGSQPPETITKLCDAIREELEKKDIKTYVNSILTAHVVKSPPDHEAGLSLLLRLKDAEPDLVEDAVKYIIFLVDADKLFDTALGMYDFSLVLLIAQHSQKDPREYLPFLRELRALETYYQRFRIDDHLRRHASALKNLSLAGDARFDEAIQYVERHQLYNVALSIWKETSRHKSILEVYGDWLFERREFRQAASVFIEACNYQKAMVSQEKALEWQELFELAIKTEMSEEGIVATAYRLSEDLTSKKRHSEAARVLLDYAHDVRTAVVTLVQGNEFSEARRIITLNRIPELLEEIVYPGALESRVQIADDLSEMKEQLRKQLNRVRELRVKKVEEPDDYYGVEDTALHNVDVMTDVSMAPTAFTRYTVAPSTASRASKRSSRSKRKMERKVGSGRKGTVDEEEYLLRSVTKLIGRFCVTREEGKRLLPHLLQFTPEHREEGSVMQEELSAFEKELEHAVDEIWAKTTAVDSNGAGGEDAVPQDTWAARMEEAEKNRRTNPVERVPKPVIPADGRDWKLKLFELGC